MTSLLVLGAPLELLLEATLVLALAALAARLLRRTSAAARHLAWALGLGAVLALPVLSLVTPSFEIALPVLVAPGDETPAFTSAAAAPLPDGLESWRSIDAPAPAPALAPVAPPPARRAPVSSLALVLGAAWALGTAVALARFAAALARARALARRGRVATERDVDCVELAASLGLARAPRVVECDDVDVPMTFGALRPDILVPAGFHAWSDDRRRAVLLHELAHVQRRDWLVQVLAQAAGAAFWFHPLVRIASARLRQEAEQAADDLVLAHGTKPSSYAAHLVDLVRALQPSPRSHAMTVSMIGGPFDGRIRAILDAARPRGPVSSRVRAALVVATSAVLFAVASIDVAAAPRERSSWDKMKDSLAEVYHSNPKDGGDWYDRGMSQHRRGEHAAAIESFHEAIAMDVKPGASAYNIACGHALSGRPDDAMAWLQRAVDSGFDVDGYLFQDQDLASLRGDARFQRFAEEHAADERAESRRRFEALRDSDSRDAGEWSSLGIELHYSGDHATAAQAFQRAVALGKTDSIVAYNLACALAMGGGRAAALDALERAVESGWDDSEHAREDGDLASLRGDARFEATLKDMDLLRGPGHVRKMMGHFTGDDTAAWRETVASREAFVAGHPDSGAGWFQLGFAALRAGRPERGLEAFRKAHELGYRPGTSAYNIACSHALAGRRDAAFEWLARSEAEGFDVEDHASDDDDLATLRDDARFDRYERERHSWFSSRTFAF